MPALPGLLLLSILCGGCCCVVANRRGAKAFYWFLIGVLPGPLAIPFAFFSKPRDIAWHAVASWRSSFPLRLPPWGV